MLLNIGAYKDRDRYLARSLEIACTLETMVQEILTISRLEAAGGELKKEPFDCVEAVKRYLRETEDLIAQKELWIRLELPQTAFVQGNRMLMEKVFSNLIGNAIQYSPPEASIRISGHMERGNFASLWRTVEHIYRRKVSRSSLTPFTAWSSPGAGKPAAAGWDCMSPRGSCGNTTVNAPCAIRLTGFVFRLLSRL